MKRGVSVLIILCIIISLSACQGKGSTIDEKAYEETIIRIISPYTQSNSDALTASFCEAIKQAQAKFPQYTIIHNAINTETYKDKIKINMAANEPMDIFFSWTEGFLEPFVNKQLVLKLDDYIVDMDAPFEDERFSKFEMDGNIYGIGMGYWYGVLYCNTELFSEYGLELPKTWEELVEACLVFNKNEIEPFACGLRDIWPGHLLVCQLMLQMMGAEAYHDMAKGEIPYDYNTMEIVGDYVLELVKAGAFSKGSFNKGNDDAALEFFSGKAAMFFNGSCHSKSAQAEAVRGKIVAVSFPIVKECRYPTDYIGKYSTGLCVASSTPHPKEAAEVALYIAEQAAINQGSLTMWEMPDNAQRLNEVEQEIAAIAEKGTGWGNNYDVVLPSRKGTEFLNAVIKLYKQESDGKIFASEAAKIFK